MKRDSREAKANKASQLLEDETLKAAFNGVEADIIKQLKNADLNGSEDASSLTLELARQLQTVTKVRYKLEAQVNNFKIISS